MTKQNNNQRVNLLSILYFSFLLGSALHPGLSKGSPKSFDNKEKNSKKKQYREQTVSLESFSGMSFTTYYTDSDNGEDRDRFYSNGSLEQQNDTQYFNNDNDRFFYGDNSFEQQDDAEYFLEEIKRLTKKALQRVQEGPQEREKDIFDNMVNKEIIFYKEKKNFKILSIPEESYRKIYDHIVQDSKNNNKKKLEGASKTLHTYHGHKYFAKLTQDAYEDTHLATVKKILLQKEGISDIDLLSSIMEKKLGSDGQRNYFFNLPGSYRPLLSRENIKKIQDIKEEIATDEAKILENKKLFYKKKQELEELRQDIKNLTKNKNNKYKYKENLKKLLFSQGDHKDRKELKKLLKKENEIQGFLISQERKKEHYDLKMKIIKNKKKLSHIQERRDGFYNKKMITVSFVAGNISALDYSRSCKEDVKKMEELGSILGKTLAILHNKIDGSHGDLHLNNIRFETDEEKNIYNVHIIDVETAVWHLKGSGDYDLQVQKTYKKIFHEGQQYAPYKNLDDVLRFVYTIFGTDEDYTFTSMKEKKHRPVSKFIKKLFISYVDTLNVKCLKEFYIHLKELRQAMKDKSFKFQEGRSPSLLLDEVFKVFKIDDLLTIIEQEEKLDFSEEEKQMLREKFAEFKRGDGQKNYKKKIEKNLFASIK